MATGELRSRLLDDRAARGLGRAGDPDPRVPRRRRVRDHGQKMWATNGLRAGMVMLLAVTDPEAEPRHRGMTAFIIEKEPTSPSSRASSSRRR